MRKKNIFWIILGVIGAVSVGFNIYVLCVTKINQIKTEAFNQGLAQAANSIQQSLQTEGEVRIYIPTKDGKTQSLTLIQKK